MDSNSEQTLASLIRGTRIATLGTLHEGEPNQAMVAYACAEDFSAFYIHVSRLGKHTRDMEKDPRVSMLITEPDHGRADPQTLTRVSIRGQPRYSCEMPPPISTLNNCIFRVFPDQSHYLDWGISIYGKSFPKTDLLWQTLAEPSTLHRGR